MDALQDPNSFFVDNGLTEDPPSDTLLLAEIILGQDAEAFVKSDIGRYLIGRANQDATDATIELKKVSPWRRRRITELQNKIRVAERIKAWLVEAVTAGSIAFKELDRLRNERDPSDE